MSTTRQPIPTAPYNMPLVGHIPALLYRPMSFLAETRGLGDIVRVRLGRRPWYLVNSPELIRRLVVTDGSKFERGRLFQKARSLVGNGLIVTEGSFHRRQRRIMQPAFHRERVASYVDAMRDQITKLVVAWEPGQLMAVDKEMTQLALTTSAKVLFSADMISTTVEEVCRLLPIVVKGILHDTVAPDRWSNVPTPGHRRYRAAHTRLRAVVDDLITWYQAEGIDHGDLLSQLMAARDAETGEPMSAAQLRDEVITSLFAATETTAASLSWLFHALGRNPDVDKRVNAEIGDLLAGRPIRSSDIEAMEYTGRVVKETLRRHSPVWFVLRRALVPVDFGAVQLPADSQVLYSPASVHRNPDLYPDPLRFDPDRWLPDRAEDLPRYAFIPFSAGSHQCIGDSFAWTEMIVAVATIISRWRLVPAAGYRVREAALTTLRPSALPMTPVPR